MKSALHTSKYPQIETKAFRCDGVNEAINFAQKFHKHVPIERHSNIICLQFLKSSVNRSTWLQKCVCDSSEK